MTTSCETTLACEISAPLSLFAAASLAMVIMCNDLESDLPFVEGRQHSAAAITGDPDYLDMVMFHRVLKVSVSCAIE
jgi:hypothetical protein